MPRGELVERGAVTGLGAGDELLVVVSATHHGPGCKGCR